MDIIGALLLLLVAFLIFKTWQAVLIALVVLFVAVAVYRYLKRDRVV